MGSDCALHFLNGVRGGANKSVIKRKPEPVLGWQMRINDLGIGAVGFAQSGKELVSLCGEVIFVSDGEEGVARK